ncbi:hypothetical protein CANCADRAFT_122641 [Tortispora caseinolytica NRRL Y-17796]|uniref:C2H2-type domain-containing protein n=1 Tax=Tortispora caseinolytica NRRL Y-17796 TaxID=767744 RepID=A0A1E4THW8_9ASCO|nr:hypothetical protein CANCADRAFT_122641 [Tortispora caseinolytica NRRL Y-17796]
MITTMSFNEQYSIEPDTITLTDNASSPIEVHSNSRRVLQSEGNKNTAVDNSHLHIPRAYGAYSADSYNINVRYSAYPELRASTNTISNRIPVSSSSSSLLQNYASTISMEDYISVPTEQRHFVSSAPEFSTGDYLYSRSPLSRIISDETLQRFSDDIADWDLTLVGTFPDVAINSDNYTSQYYLASDSHDSADMRPHLYPTTATTAASTVSSSPNCMPYYQFSPEQRAPLLRIHQSISDISSSSHYYDSPNQASESSRVSSPEMKSAPESLSSTSTVRSAAHSTSFSTNLTQRQIELLAKSRKKGSFRCSHCSKTFSTGLEYYNHLREENIERHYKCTACSDCPWEIIGFSKHCDYKRHIRFQHQVRGYTCREPNCNREFMRTDSRVRHERKAHNRLQ